MKNKIFLIFLLLLSFISCEDLEDSQINLDTEITSVSYGTSFGECIGYCKQSVEIKDDVIKFIAQSWAENDKYPDITITSQIPKAKWEELIGQINFIVFRNMEEVIGCPDCADGGAEWIKIETSDQSHKITFEYNNPPQEVQAYTEKLSALLLEFQEEIF